MTHDGFDQAEYDRLMAIIDANRPKRPNPGPYKTPTTADAWQAATPAGRIELEVAFTFAVRMGEAGDTITFDDGSTVFAEGREPMEYDA